MMNEKLKKPQNPQKSWGSTRVETFFFGKKIHDGRIVAESSGARG